MGLTVQLSIEVNTGGSEPHVLELFEKNITHNAAPIWCKAEIFNLLYRSYEQEAGSLFPELARAFTSIVNHEEEFRNLIPESSEWGDYDSAKDFLGHLISACQNHPKAIFKSY